ncbi:MAG: hypothetical protein Q7N50_04840, partial [Armatimonadota bacterium]|nr:hypothetical protein [Armatimonadota bacterium]
MNDVRITKSDVPYLYRGRVLYFGVAMILGGWVIGTLGNPQVRPNVIEFLVGVGLGIPAGLLYSVVHLAYVVELSRRCQTNRRLLWLIFIWRGSTLLGWLLPIVFMILMFFGALTVAPISVFLIQHCQDLCGASRGDEGGLAMTSVYFFVMMLVSMLPIIRWYNRLPS